MGKLLKNSFPENIQKELEHIQKLIMPLAKKTSRYLFLTYPLIGIAVLNLVILLFFSPRENHIYPMLFVYAVIGAIGLALLKETRINKKEIQKIGILYIIDRIKKSGFVTEEKKVRYIRLVSERPVLAMENFVKFLQEEDRMKRLAAFSPEERDTEINNEENENPQDM